MKQAQSAADYYANDTKYTEESLANVTAYLNGVLNTNSIGDGDSPEQTATTVAEARENGIQYIDTTPIKDDLENTVYIPGGFRIAKDSGTKVEEGIVIEDEEGNQFVWKPTGEYKATDITSTENPKLVITKTNELSRRQFSSSKDILVEGDNAIALYYYGEGNEHSCTITDEINSIDAFLDSAKPITEGGHGGFYIGRYESGTEIERTSNDDDLTIPLVQRNKNAYVYVTRDQAKTEAENMYNGKTDIKATPQLISSYAWDTALNFICQNSEYGYELATTTSEERANFDSENKMKTGEYIADLYSNICDLLGNCREWTTEYSTFKDSSGIFWPCVDSGSYYNKLWSAAGMSSYKENEFFSNLSFRISLYV